MPLFDLPLEALQRYRPDLSKPADFGAFWDATLAEARAHPLNPVFAKVETPLKTVESYDVTFAGYGGQSIKAWLSLPVALSGTSGRLPCVVEYIGYGGGRGFPSDWLLYPSAGYAHLVMDTRGQGSSWSKGDTPDLPTEGSSPHTPGFMTLGVLSPQTYYYRRLFTDAVRAVEAARAFDHVDVDRVAVTGGSQGGGVSLAVAGLVPDVALVLPDVPFLCHYRRATELVDTHPYAEISRFCNVHRDRVETVFHTLSYFDGVNFAAQAQTRALFSVALMDTICPPSTVYAAYNHYAGPKDINVYSYNGHEGGQSYQSLAKLAFLNEHLPL